MHKLSLAQLLVLALWYAASFEAQAQRRDPPTIPDGCEPQSRPLGGGKGAYPEGSLGKPVFKSLGSQRDYDEKADFDIFQRVKHLAPVAFERSPYESEPEEARLQVAGYIADLNGTVREPDATGRLLSEEEIENMIQAHGRNLNVFLPDTRVEVNEAAYPYRAVGKWRGCTASIVYNNDIVVTNSHCLKYLDNGKMDPAMWDETFYAGFNNGNFLKFSKPKAIWYDKDDDFTVMKLWKPIGNDVGGLGVWWRGESFFSSKDRSLRMISYSSDHCTSWSNCRQKLSTGKSRGTQWIGNDVYHDLDAKRGSSGSAMWNYYNGIPVMDALNFAEFRDGGEVSLTVPGGYDSGKANIAKPAGVWKYGYDKIKNA